MAARKNELAYRLDERRLSLLKERAAMLATRKVTDATLRQQIAELADKLRAWEVKSSEQGAEAQKGLVKLGKKTADGNVVRV